MRTQRPRDFKVEQLSNGVMKTRSQVFPCFGYSLLYYLILSTINIKWIYSPGPRTTLGRLFCISESPQRGQSRPNPKMKKAKPGQKLGLSKVELCCHPVVASEPDERSAVLSSSINGLFPKIAHGFSRWPQVNDRMIISSG